MTATLPVSRQWPSLIGWLTLSLATGVLGAIASRHAAEFYAALSRPPWAPPAGVFGPVWTTLYVMMGFAAWIAWRHRMRTTRLAHGLFVAQLVFNALWSWLFFEWHRGALAFADILLLLALIIATIITFWRVSALAGMLLLPYLAWVSFATALTFSVWQRNPALL